MKTKSLQILFPITALTAVFALAFVASTSAQKGKSPVKLENIEKISSALPAEAPAKAAKKHKVLVFSKTNGFRHGSIPTGVECMKMLGKKTGVFEVTASEDEAMFEPETLKQFDAVIMLNTTGEVFRPKQMPPDPDEKKAAMEREERLKQSLVAFVKGGKGLIGMHSATDTYKNWKEYNDMMGGAFAGHPWHTDVELKNLAPDSPVNAAFDKNGFRVKDEIYQFRDDTASPKERRMLLSLDADKMDVSKGRHKTTNFYPISWIDNYGEGRVFYCSLGHRDEIFWNPTVLKHYLAGIQYALGDLKADATPQ